MKRLLCVALSLALCGCGAVEPATQFSYGVFGVQFKDTKDNDIELKGAKWRDISIDSLIIRNNSSDVMTANVAQIAALNEQMRIHGENIRAGIAELSGLVRAATPMAGMFSPGAAVSGPLGSASISNAAINQAIEAYLEKKFGKAAEAVPTSAPASQPVQ